MKAVCSVATCDRVALCRTWCEAHYTRWRRHGDVMADVPVGPVDGGARPLPKRRLWFGQYNRGRTKVPAVDLIDTDEL